MPHDENNSLIDVDLNRIRNRNEGRVATCLRQTLESTMNLVLSDSEIQDVYAFALNQLPPRYTQPGTIVLGDPVRNEHIQDAVDHAIDFVMNRPKS